jgi:hypothetical protein
MAKKGRRPTDIDPVLREEQKAEKKRARAEKSAQRSREWRARVKAEPQDATQASERIDLTTTLSIRTQVLPSAIIANHGITISQELGSFSQTTSISPPPLTEYNSRQPSSTPSIGRQYNAPATRSSSRQASTTSSSYRENVTNLTQASGSSRKVPKQPKKTGQGKTTLEDQVDKNTIEGENIYLLTRSIGDRYNNRRASNSTRRNLLPESPG